MFFIRLFLMPDSPSGNVGTPKPINKTRLVPRKDADIGSVATLSNRAWDADPDLKLKWITQKEFELLATRYNQNLQVRVSAGGEQPGKTNLLKAANTNIDNGLARVKKMINNKYETDEEAKAQYARYGMVKVGNRYQLPGDNDKRSKALPLMLAAISTDGFDGEKYGKAYWTAAIADFEKAVDESKGASRKITTTVSTKDVDKEQILKALKAFTNLLEANYPDTYAAKLREWGFMKQNF